MFQWKQDGPLLRAETGGGAVEWDARRGGEIAAFALKDSHGSHRLAGGGATWPGLVLAIGGKRFRLADAQAEIEALHVGEDEAEFAARCVLADGAVVVEMRYEVFAEGAMFCEFSLEGKEGARGALTDAWMGFPADLSGAHGRWGWFSREPAVLRDPTCVHVMPTWRPYQPLDASAQGAELPGLVSLDLGWNARLFSNRLEFVLEDWAAVGDGPTDQTAWIGGGWDDGWGLRWYVLRGGNVPVGPQLRYRNRWGLFWGAARTEAGAGADPARRNNALGARIVHCSYPYARLERGWPWRVMPGTQSKYVAPRYFQGLPDPSRAREAAQAGADLVILHQFWMRNPGSNNEPPADYHPLDPDWLRAFVSAAHGAGLRVCLYMRGTEMHALYSDYFEEFLEPGRDGLYVDWSSAMSYGWAKASPRHFSAHNYFHMTRALRRRVGEGGVVIAHSSMHTQIALANVDAALSGEGASQRDSLLSSAEACACFGVQGGCGLHLISGNPHDRKAFHGPRVAALGAALGIVSHTGMGPESDTAATTGPMRPLWNLLAALDGQPVRLFSEAAGTGGVESDSGDAFACAYQDAKGNALLMLSNLGETRDARAKVDLERLGLPADAVGQVVGEPMAEGIELGRGEIRARGLKADGFCGALFRAGG